MKSYLITHHEYQTRVVWFEKKWHYVAEDVLLELGYDEIEPMLNKHCKGDWAYCLLDTPTGKILKPVISFQAIYFLVNNSPLGLEEGANLMSDYQEIEYLLKQEGMTDEGICAPVEKGTAHWKCLVNQNKAITSHHKKLIEKNQYLPMLQGVKELEELMER